MPARGAKRVGVRSRAAHQLGAQNSEAGKSDSDHEESATVSSLREFARGASLFQTQRMVCPSWHLGRIIGLGLLLWMEGYVQTSIRTDEIKLAAPIENLRSAIFPDLDDYHEKMDNGMEMLVSFDQFQHTAQVLKHLSFFQDFCASSGGLDSRNAATWICMVKTIKVTAPANPVLQGQDNMNCSEAWIRKHVVVGDNTDEVPLGTAPKDVTLKEGFEQWPFWEHSGFWQGAEQATRNVMEEMRTHRKGTSMLEVGVFDNGHFQSGRAGRRHKLHSRLLEEEESASKAPDTYSFSGPQCADPHARDILSVCRNHHWGPLVFLCRPEAVSVSYHITNEYSPKFWQNFPKNGVVDGKMMLDKSSEVERKTTQKFIDFKLEYKRIGGADTGWYEGHVKIKGGDASCSTDNFLAFVAVMTVVLAHRLIFDAVCCFLLTPWLLYKLCSMRYRSEEVSENEIWEAIRYHADPSQARLTGEVSSDPRKVANGSLLLEVYLENVLALFLITAKLSSFYICLFVPTTWKWGADGLPIKGDHGAKTTMYDVCAGNYLGFFVEGGWTFGGELQRAALLLVIIRMNLAARKLQTFVWWPAVLTVAMGKMASFIVFFVMLLLSWALYLHLAFGDAFIAFYSVSKAVETLTFYTFGLVDPHYYHMNHNEEPRAWELTAWLTAFQIIVATIGINFFMAIVLSAYDKVLTKRAETHDLIIAQTLIDVGRKALSALFPTLRPDVASKQGKGDKKRSIFQHNSQEDTESEEPTLHEGTESEEPKLDEGTESEEPKLHEGTQSEGVSQEEPVLAQSSQ